MKVTLLGASGGEVTDPLDSRASAISDRQKQ